MTAPASVRDELVSVSAELEGVRAELQSSRDETDRARSEADANRDAAQRVEEAERKLVEMQELEQRIADAHAFVERMRTDFELEREGYAVSERELRGQVASETTRREELAEAHDALVERVDGLESQNAALREAYETAKQRSSRICPRCPGARLYPRAAPARRTG